MSINRVKIHLPTLPTTLPASEFATILSRELEGLGRSLLPLQACLTHGSYVSDEPIKVSVLGLKMDKQMIYATIGIHYSSIIAGCSCADDPTPVDTLPEYCEIHLRMNEGETEADLIF